VIKTGLGDYSNIEMCIMFSKMHIYCPAGHDSLEEHFQIFDQYLKRVSPIIKEHKGFVSKFLSGGFMALFPKSELDAVKAALEIKACVEDFNVTLSVKNHKLQAWMGIHFGKMIIGTIGEENRLDDTVISDTVNTSSRLEGVCEKLGKTIIISQEVMERLGAEQVLPFETIRLQDVIVKGKEKPLQIYEVVEK
jgi:class 3 adenylate cyclase